MVHRAAAAAYAQLFNELIAGPSTVPELVAVSGMHINTVRVFLKAMRHIEAIECIGKEPSKDGRLRRKVWALRNWKRKSA